MRRVSWWDSPTNNILMFTKYLDYTAPSIVYINVGEVCVACMGYLTLARHQYNLLAHERTPSYVKTVAGTGKWYIIGNIFTIRHQSKTRN